MPEPEQPPSDSSLASPTVNATSSSNQPVQQEHWPLKRIPIQPALSWFFLASILLIFLALVAIAQFLVFPDSNRWAPWCVAVYRATQGLIDFTLMLGLFLQVLIIGILVIGIGRLRPRELGLDIAKLPAGVAWTFAAWLAAQLVTLLLCVVAGEPIGLNPAWSFGSWTQPAGEWIAQLFGNAALEEVLYRGFLFPQCVWLASSWFRDRSDRWRIAIALLISQGWFALGHIPFNFVGGGWSGQWSLIYQFLMGLAFCGIYIRTGNLFLAIGFHALANNPGPLLTGGTIAEILPMAIVHLLILALIIGRPKSLMALLAVVTLGWLFARGDYSEQAQFPKQVVFFPTPESPLEIPSKVSDVLGEYDLQLLGERKQLSVGCFDVIHATYTYG
jgi:membrane protease YdiL (CAAX protease family)